MYYASRSAKITLGEDDGKLLGFYCIEGAPDSVEDIGRTGIAGLAGSGLGARGKLF